MSIVRFPTEQCRLPGQTREEFAFRQACAQFVAARTIPPVKWDPPLLEELANGETSE